METKYCCESPCLLSGYNVDSSVGCEGGRQHQGSVVGWAEKCRTGRRESEVMGKEGAERQGCSGRSESKASIMFVSWCNGWPFTFFSEAGTRLLGEAIPRAVTSPRRR
jgi:hypothetical protein